MLLPPYSRNLHYNKTTTDLALFFSDYYSGTLPEAHLSPTSGVLKSAVLIRAIF